MPVYDPTKDTSYEGSRFKGGGGSATTKGVETGFWGSQYVGVEEAKRRESQQKQPKKGPLPTPSPRVAGPKPVAPPPPSGTPGPRPSPAPVPKPTEAPTPPAIKAPAPVPKTVPPSAPTPAAPPTPKPALPPSVPPPAAPTAAPADAPEAAATAGLGKVISPEPSAAPAAAMAGLQAAGPEPMVGGDMLSQGLGPYRPGLGMRTPPPLASLMALQKLRVY